MIYNLVKYLSDNLVSLYFVANGFQKNTPDIATDIKEGWGVENTQINRKDFSVLTISRAIDKPTARANAYAVYNLINKKFGLVLPEETVASTVYPQIKTWKIVSTNLPTPLGSDENGKTMFSTNYIITTE